MIFLGLHSNLLVDPETSSVSDAECTLDLLLNPQLSDAFGVKEMETERLQKDSSPMYLCPSVRMLNGFSGGIKIAYQTEKGFAVVSI